MKRLYLILTFFVIWILEMMFLPAVSFIAPIALFLAGITTLNILLDYRRALYYSLWFGLLTDAVIGRSLGVTALSWLSASLVVYLIIKNIVSNRERFSKLGLYTLALVVNYLVLIGSLLLLEKLNLNVIPLEFSGLNLLDILISIIVSLLAFPLIYKTTKKVYEFVNKKEATIHI
ncbi:MAG: hypothetical protein ABIE68_02290 [bacterium]